MKEVLKALLATIFKQKLIQSSGPRSLDRNSRMLSEIFCDIFVVHERSRRWHDDHDAIIPRRLKLKRPWPPCGGDRTLSELAEQFDVHPNQIQDWKQKLITRAENVFGAGLAEVADHEPVQQKLHAKIGQLTMEKDCLANALGHSR